MSGWARRLAAGACALSITTVSIVVSDSASEAASGPVPCARAVYPSLRWVQCEADNVALATQNITANVGALPGIVRATAAYAAQRRQVLRSDPERHPDPNTCTTVAACPIDPRLGSWTSNGGLVRAVLFTSRSGATLSGHVWATRRGAARRPGVFFINGSVAGYEQAYVYLAQTLARAGFVVMTFDVQGEGMSDQYGEQPDAVEDAYAGTPLTGILGTSASTGRLGGNGLAFYDGGEDALDFFLSTPARPYVPVPSRTTRTSHAAKQSRRVAAHLDSAYNPLWRMLDRRHIGVAGHSYGAAAASWLGQSDPRIKAVVALDNLCIPRAPSPDELTAFAATNPDYGGQPTALHGLPTECFGAPMPASPALRRPALGISSDYLAFPTLVPTPFLAPPNRWAKTRASLAYTRAGVDTGEIGIRGGTHLDFTDAPGMLPATYRGIDLAAWYTTAWFQRYLGRRAAGEKMLLTRRWLHDPIAQKLDPSGDANVLSWHFGSRLDVHLTDGSRWTCNNLHHGCRGMVSATRDGMIPRYSWYRYAR